MQFVTQNDPRKMLNCQERCSTSMLTISEGRCPFYFTAYLRGEEAFVCLVPHEAIVSIYLHVCAMCMQKNLMKITTTRAFASVAANQNLLCTISTMEKPQSLSNYLIILMQMRFRTKIGVQGSSQKKCKRKEKNQESHLNVPACIYKMTTLASFAAPPRRVVRLVSTSWCSNEWLKKSFTEFVYSEHICSQRILFSN